MALNVANIQDKSNNLILVIYEGGMAAKNSAERKLNLTLKAVNGTLGTFTKFVTDLKKHNDTLANVREYASKRIEHYNGLDAIALQKMSENRNIISKVEGLLN